MLISKQVERSIIQSLYDSSNVIASQYNTETRNLVVIFDKGGQYLYEGVSHDDFMRFESSDSQGKSLNTHIKKYSSRKLGEIDTTPIKEDIKLIIEEQRKS